MLLTRFFNWLWYSGSPATWLFWPILWPLSRLFGFLACRNKTKKIASITQPLPVPLVVVGNITVGGTGKTPMIVALIERLRQQGYKPGVISRGYGAKTDQFPFAVDANTASHVGGDEPTMIAQRCQCPVVIDPLRTRAVNYLLKYYDVDIIVSDDGLQHYALARDIELCLIDTSRALGSGQLMPLGPLREPKNRLECVDFIIANGAKAPNLGVNTPSFTMTIAPTHWRNVKTAQIRPHLPADQPYWAIAGIGNPQRFYDTLKQQGLAFNTKDFADHQSYSPESFNFLGTGESLLMTEKDAVKCRDFSSDNWWYLQVNAELDENFWRAFLQQLDSLKTAKQAKEKT